MLKQKMLMCRDRVMVMPRGVSTRKLKICVSKFTSVYASTKETTKSFPENSSRYPLPSLTGAGLPSIVLMIDLFMHVVDILAGQLSLPDCYHRLIELIGG